jgi:hypothetical protein
MVRRFRRPVNAQIVPAQPPSGKTTILVKTGCRVSMRVRRAGLRLRAHPTSLLPARCEAAGNDSAIDHLLHVNAMQSQIEIEEFLR